MSGKLRPGIRLCKTSSASAALAATTTTLATTTLITATATLTTRSTVCTTSDVASAIAASALTTPTRDSLCGREQLR